MQLSHNLPNVRFLNLQPFERLNALLNLADTHLLPQIPNAADLVMPSKLQGMLASGRPVIATAKPGTQIASVVQQCGIVVSPGDVTAIAKAITYLASDREKCQQLGRAARQYAIQYWDRQQVLKQLERKLLELCSLPQPERLDLEPKQLKSVRVRQHP
jgi:colanic acid biosynthesis glycosyl transferase WcaI